MLATSQLERSRSDRIPWLAEVLRLRSEVGAPPPAQSLI
jgi:hypothetical protein